MLPTSRRRFLAATGLLAGRALFPAVARAEGARAATPALLERARALLARAPLIDTHNDLPAMLLDAHLDPWALDLTRPQPALCADLPRLREGRVGAQYWSIYVDSGTARTHTALRDALRAFDVALRFIRRTPGLRQVRTAAELRAAVKAGEVACLLGVEGGHMLEDSLASLRVFQELGARYLTLTHWDTVGWADSATDRGTHGGLTALGRQVVKELNRLGMFADLSHVSEDTMHDALAASRAPVLFSHSNARARCPHPRNVPDEVLRKVAANGGVVHLNFIADFVTAAPPEHAAARAARVREAHRIGGSDAEVAAAVAAWDQAHPAPRATIGELAGHVDHLRQVAGVAHVGIGADFYEATGTPMVEGLGDVSRYPLLFAELLGRGYTDDELLGIAGKNHLRALEAVEKVAAGLQATEAPQV